MSDKFLVIVDDQKSVLDSLLFALEEGPIADLMEIKCYTKPKDALTFVEENHDDIPVLVTDINMPGMNGFELAIEAGAWNTEKKENTEGWMSIILFSGRVGYTELHKMIKEHGNKGGDRSEIDAELRAHTEEEIKIQDYIPGAECRLFKPVDPEILEELILKKLEKQGIKSK